MAEPILSARRRLALLLSIASVIAVGWTAVPTHAAMGQPATVARHVTVSLSALVGAPVRPARIHVDGSGSLDAAVRTRTPFAPVCSSIWSTMVAFSWKQSGSDATRAEVRSADGRPLDVLNDLDAQPDRGTAEWHPHRRTTALYWTRGAWCVRLSLALPAGSSVRRLQATFLNTSGSAAGPGTGPPDTAVAASSSAGAPPMVTRAQWGAVAPRKHCLGYEPYVKMAYVHHTSGTNNYTRAQADDIVRGIQYFHEFTRGYCDIAYNFLVDRFGTIFVGRYDSDNTSVNVDPASQMGFNPYTFSVSAMGDFQVAKPPRALIASIERVLAWRLDVAHLDPMKTASMTSTGGPTTRYRRGQTVRLPLISGHRQTGITDCPGNRIWWRLPEIRRHVFRMDMPKFFDPRQSKQRITPITETDRIRAVAPISLDWEVDVVNTSGQVVRTITASGIELDIEWNGTDDHGLPVPPGRYTLSIQARDPVSGRAALGATLPVRVNFVFPPPP